MTAQQLLTILVPLQAALGSLLLGLGQQSLALPSVAIFVAASSAYFTDYLGWFRLHPQVANMAAVIAVGAAMLQFMESGSAEQLFAVANLLIYLQMILLYQQKTDRIYWHIAVLSLLQVVVAAALNLGFEFGLLLILYMFLALATMTVLFVRLETNKPEKLDEEPHRDGERTPVLVAIHQPHTDVRMLNRQLAWHVLRFGTTTLLLTLLVFFFTPRFGKSPWRSAARAKTRLVGFASEVSLNDLGRILESDEVVMRVQFWHEQDGKPEPYVVRGEPYFRGSVLTRYAPIDGVWTGTAPHMMIGLLPLPEPPKRAEELVYQTIVIEPSTSLFSVFPVFAMSTSDKKLRVALGSNLLAREDLDKATYHSPYAYEVATTAFRHGLPRPLTPATGGVRQRTPQALLSFDAQRCPTIARVAEQVLADAGVEPAERAQAAKALEAHFLGSAGYQYTLNLEERPPPGTDPLDYFVSTHRRGHCEYFAGALALMLRSQGIPARVVVGYRGGDFNSVGHYFLVKQLHAHAWVEAYLEPDQIPDFLAAGQAATSGGWLRLDPTPGGGDDGVVVARLGLWSQLVQIWDYMQVLWSDYVVRLDPQRQREAIYQPLLDTTTASVRDMLFNPDWWVAFGEDLVYRLGLNSLHSFRQRWVNWRSVPVLAAFLISLAIAYFLLRPLSRSLRIRFNWWRRRRRARRRWQRNRQLAFYRRMERLFARHGLRRQPGQTAREFADTAVHALDGRLRTVRHLPQLLVDHYYQVRFGHQTLEPADLARMDRAVHELEHALRAV